MEHPEIFTPAAYEEILHSMQPIYGLTAGLTNKLIIKLMHQILDEQSLQTEFLPDEIKEFYHLADDNYAISTVHFPGNMQELLAARKRISFVYSGSTDLEGKNRRSSQCFSHEAGMDHRTGYGRSSLSSDEGTAKRLA